jgi:hypothetical protein
MKRATRLLIVIPILLPLLGCVGIEEAPPRPDPQPELPEEIARELPETPEEEREPVLPERPPLGELLPSGMSLVTKGGEPVKRRGDFDGDGREDTVYLAVSGDSTALDALGAEERLYETDESGSRESRLLLRLASREDLLLNPGDFLLLAEFSTLPLMAEPEESRGDTENRDSSERGEVIAGDLIYLRFEDRQQQRHLLFSVDPLYKTPHRYLFLTDSVTGFFVRDVDGDRRSEVVHVETTVSAGGVEESFYTLYQFRRRELERSARVPVVERTNELFQEIRTLLISGDRELLMRRHTADSGRKIDRYFLPLEASPISQVPGVEFVYVPELRSNPFDLAEKPPELETEILLLAGGEEQLYRVRIGFVVEPRRGPTPLLLPAVNSD